MDRPLFGWTAEAVSDSTLVDRCVVSTDDVKIAEVAKSYGLEVPFLRPSELALDDTPALPVIFHAVDWTEKEGKKPDIIVLLQPTSPLRTGKHIDEALTVLINDSEADSIVSVTDVPHQYAPGSVMVDDGRYLLPWLEQDENRNLRQFKTKYLARNGAAIYAFRRSTLKNKNSIYGDHILSYYMTAEESIDIDTAFELKICGMLLKERLLGLVD